MSDAKLYRVLDRRGDLHRAADGRTRFPYDAACTIARKVDGRVIV